ncbi:hypothetical protein TTHERM_00112780 (macronuclear) [Tetrahymena thermophila SB210]|uniref:Uncharacterized protein n=1 Tax=Tetrahymena thermophila (strain SB210) TaxID=312017 RepID=Q22Z93_TETTS|nr:hypothetical protein TTHERM_00112780 [Tetrahymena thermophila SB210]EAR90428.1 hypothetical protein TTHERM_00112780 [Tetrahymena thermophila SB210]|eukprot:XP_001010673.1 hypothetical protein TTHERM_00112780 [Tetrahymena thermophila SB210]
MDEQESAKISYDNLIKRVQRLNEDFTMLIDSITDLRDKMYTFLDQSHNIQVQINQTNSNKKLQSQFASSSSYHTDYQYLQNNFDANDKSEYQQFIKDVAKDFWKLYLKFSFLDGNRVNHALIKARALGYNIDDILEKKEILKKYFIEQSQLDESQKQAQIQSEVNNNNKNNQSSHTSLQQV